LKQTPTHSFEDCDGRLPRQKTSEVRALEIDEGAAAVTPTHRIENGGLTRGSAREGAVTGTIKVGKSCRHGFKIGPRAVRADLVMTGRVAKRFRMTAVR
jgi:hypothetical protein